MPRILRQVVVALALVFAAPAVAAPVDLELVLAVDCSGSINSEEFALQIGGYAMALRHPSVIRAIQSGRYGAIAVTYVQWSGAALQNQMVRWTLVKDAASAEALAVAVSSAPRTIFGGGTSLSGAIDHGRSLFGTGEFEGVRRVIDVSGDGTNNGGRRPEQARDEAVNAGITINGLAILTDVPALDRYFEDRVVGGPGAFVIAATTFENFAAAILNKLIREIADLSALPQN